MRKLWLGMLFALALLRVTTAIAMNEVFIDRVEERGSILVPLRGVFEALGASVHWDAAGQSIDVSLHTRDINMFINDYQAYVDGKLRRMTVPPRMIRGRVYIPLRFVGETLGGIVSYRNNSAIIRSPGATQLKISFLATRGPVSKQPDPVIYIADWTSKRAASNSDMTGNSNWELTLMREEIGARKGKPFQLEFIRSYFVRQPWYSPNYDYTPAWLTQMEHDNAEFILAYQRRVYGTPASQP